MQRQLPLTLKFINKTIRAAHEACMYTAIGSPPEHEFRDGAYRLNDQYIRHHTCRSKGALMT
jgi:hypothetical protein